MPSASLAEIVGSPQLSDFARAQGRVAFADNCAACHGAGGGGAKGYPNLNDDDWLWGGKLDDIMQTLRYGIRSGHEKARQGNMPPFKDMLKPAEISAVADFARSLSGLPAEKGRRSCAWQEAVRRQLRGLSRAGRQGQSRVGVRQPDRQDLALCLRQGDDHGGHSQRPRRRDADLGGSPERAGDQSPGRLCVYFRRRAKNKPIPLP